MNGTLTKGQNEEWWDSLNPMQRRIILRNAGSDHAQSKAFVNRKWYQLSGGIRRVIMRLPHHKLVVPVTAADLKPKQLKTAVHRCCCESAHCTHEAGGCEANGTSAVAFGIKTFLCDSCFKTARDVFGDRVEVRA